MEPVTISVILISALKYIFKAAGDTKLVKDAENSALSKFWGWIKPHIVKTVPEIESKPDDEETENKTKDRLLELVKDEAFFKELVSQVEALKKAGVTEKNIVKADLKNIKVVRIGDRSYSGDDRYDRKNIFEGNAEGMDEFNVGDGY